MRRKRRCGHSILRRAIRRRRRNKKKVKRNTDIESPGRKAVESSTKNPTWCCSRHKGAFFGVRYCRSPNNIIRIDCRICCTKQIKYKKTEARTATTARKTPQTSTPTMTTKQMNYENSKLTAEAATTRCTRERQYASLRYLHDTEGKRRDSPSTAGTWPCACMEKSPAHSAWKQTVGWRGAKNGGVG